MADALLEKVRGVNPVTGASPGYVEKVASDESWAYLAIALRRMPVGSFQALNGDLRSVEASCKAAELLRNLFQEYNLDVVVTGDTDNPPAEHHVDVEADDGRSAQPENKHRGTDDDEARANEQEKRTPKGGSEHPVHHEDHVTTNAKASTDAKSTKS